MAACRSLQAVRISRFFFIFQVISVRVTGGYSSVLISEINADSPESPEVSEYVELWNKGPCQVSLDGYHLAFYNVISGVPTLYRDVDLSSLCIPGNGYFLIGLKSLSLQVDLEITNPGFIQNGNGIADAIVLYNGTFGAAPSKMSTTNLVDGVVYDKLRSSDTSGLMPDYFSNEAHVWEDTKFLSEDESISRCTDEAKMMSAFMTSSLTPRAPNQCQADQITRWPSPCTEGQYPESKHRRSFQFQLKRGYKGSGTPIVRLLVKTLSECSMKCSQENRCTHFSYSQTTEQAYNCLLHDFCIVYDTPSNDWLVAERFYKMSPRNPVWPHDVPV